MSVGVAGPPRRPTIAFALGLASGILVVLSSFLLLFAFFIPSVFVVAALVFGTVILFASILMYARPREHVVWGILVLLFACLSIIGLGGFVAGMVLGIIGGSLGIAWQPQGPAFTGYATAGYGVYGGAIMGPYGVPITPWRLCMGCGRWIPWSYTVCPLCGTQTPLWSPPRTTGAPALATPHPGFPPVDMGTPQVRPFPAPAPPPWSAATPNPPAMKAPCPTCTAEAEWNAVARRWYCPAESRYF